MNNKRQTIWLVSMLSLMVILSAYYLFTEPTNTNNNAITDQASSPDAAKANGIVDDTDIQMVDTLTGEPSNTVTGDGQTDGEDNGLSPQDEQVLNQLNNLSGSQWIDQQQLQRIEQRDEEYYRLQGIMTDNKNTSPEEANSAATEMNLLEEADNRISALESKLLLSYENAVVTTEADSNSYKVIVLSDKLAKKEAVSIVDMATKELQVTPDRVSVQAVKP